jgi:hypothetical protein
LFITYPAVILLISFVSDSLSLVNRLSKLRPIQSEIVCHPIVAPGSYSSDQGVWEGASSAEQTIESEMSLPAVIREVR